MQYLLTGASGLLGRYILRELQAESSQFLACSGPFSHPDSTNNFHSIDLTNPDQLSFLLEKYHPRTIIHCAALARQMDCWQNPTLAHRINVEATQHIAREAMRLGIRFVYLSTDLVFDGTQGHLGEIDRPNPISVYGKSKLAGEQAVLESPNSIIVRVSLLYGRALSDKPSFFDLQIRSLQQRQPITLFEDEWRTPLALPTAARALLRISQSHITGLIHLGGKDRLSRLEMGEGLAEVMGIDNPCLIATKRGNDPEARPRDVSLDCSRFRSLFPDFDLGDYQTCLKEMGIQSPVPNADTV